MSSFIMIPAVGQTLPLCTHIAGETVYSATFAVAWNAFVLFWTLSAASLMLSLFSLPFWAAGFMMGKYAACHCDSIQL
jgi:hypothetical protein